jgi:hypothetical protein
VAPTLRGFWVARTLKIPIERMECPCRPPLEKLQVWPPWLRRIAGISGTEPSSPPIITPRLRESDVLRLGQSEDKVQFMARKALIFESIHVLAPTDLAIRPNLIHLLLSKILIEGLLPPIALRLLQKRSVK